jgi:hypothetical protein
MLYKVGLVINAISSLVISLLSLTAINAFSFLYAGSYYPFALPTVAIALYCMSLSTLGLVNIVSRSAGFWCVIPIGCSIYLAFLYAMSQWPGGDDGPGMFWALFVGASSGLMSVTNIVLLVLGLVVIFKKSNDT